MVDAAVAKVCGSEAIKANLRRSWGVLSADIEATGLMLMSNLFTLRPDTKTYFTRLGDVQKGKANSKLRGHAITLTYALNNFVDSLDDPSRLKCVVEKFAVNHINRKISGDAFGAIVEPMKETLKARMGNYYSDDVAGAWAALVGVVQAAL
uniref:Hemoglobin n=1 Tax=Anadara kagoshimensis TaxID=1390362 RepID=C0M1B2_9BIVA|nr:hemoglobin [Anadara kagoshimensis]